MADEDEPPVSNVLRHPVLERYDRGEPPGGGPPGGGYPEAPDLWESAPFQVLGRGDGRFWFLDKEGALVDAAANSLAQWPTLLGLCGGEKEWLVQHFRQLDRDGNPTAWFNVREATASVMRRAGALPPFDAEIPRRRYGLWKVAGGYALHRGDAIDWCGDERRAGFVEERALWLRLSPRPGAGASADAALGRALEALFATWNWRHASSPAVLLGLVVSGWIAGALEWRPHGFVVGEAGSGKTTLLRDVIAGLCPLTRYLNDYTEPGLRQLLSESATSIVLDEAEGDASTEQRLRRTIEMLRRASSGSGVQSVKGSADHVARQFTLSGSAIMGAIFPPPLEPQDASRFTVLQLNPLDTVAPQESPAAFAARHGPALWGRAIREVSRILRLFGILRARIIARGYPARLADQLATIAACRWVMVRGVEDDPRDADAEDGVDEPLAVVEHLLVDEVDRVADGAGNQALGRLLMSTLDMAGDKKTLGQVLARARTLLLRIGAAPTDLDAANTVTEDRAELRKLEALLEGHGVRWAACESARGADAPAPPMGLFVVVAAHPRLERAFADTAWSGRRWGEALRQLPGALGGRDVGPQRVGGARSRVVWVPEAHFEPPGG